MTARLAALLLLLALPAAAAPPLTVFTAASLGPPVRAAAEAFPPERADRPRIVLGSSGALARQIMLGAPGDVFLSASPVWTEALVREGLIDGTRTIAGNRLVVVAPADAPPRMPLLALARGERLALPDPAHSPLGVYAREALTSLGVWDALGNRITASPDAIASLTLVARGEAVLGIVYASQLGITDKVRHAGDIDPRHHAPITYPGAVLTASTHADAPAFLEFLADAKGRAILAAHGFAPWSD